MKIFEKYWKALAGVVALTIVVGLGAILLDQMKEKKEIKSQEAYTALETEFNLYRENLNASTDPVVTKPAPTTVNVENLKSNLQKFISEQQGSVAGQMAGLSLSEIFLNEKNAKEAVTALRAVENNKTNLTNILVRKKIAQIYSDLDQCPEAFKIWDQLLKNKTATFSHTDIKISQALCYQKMNELVKAEEILKQIKNSTDTTSDQAAKQEASKILKLIQYKKTLGT